jgi:hypothetical protein
MKTKRLIALATLVALLVAGLFILTGCGEKKEENKATQNTLSARELGQEATEFYVQQLVPNTSVTELYAAKTGTTEFSPNLLTAGALSEGTQSKIGLGMTKDAAVFDFKIVDEEGTTATFNSIDLSKIFTNNGGTVAIQIVDGTLSMVVQ